MAMFLPPTEIRMVGRPLANATSYDGYASQLEAGERIVILADSKTNNSGHPAHQAPYIDNTDDYTLWMSRWAENNYYIIGVYAVK